jgi:sugar phosphate isomerase/epimerase
MPRYSFTTLGCPAWTLDEIVANAKAYGYHGIELRTSGDGNHLKPDASPAERAALKAKCDAAGVPVFSVMGYTTFAHLEAEKVQANQQVMGQLIESAVALGAPYIRTFCGRIPAGTSQAAMIETVAKALHPLARQARERGVTIAMETHDDWCAGRVLRQVLQGVDSPGLAVVYDIFNAWSTGLETWQETYAAVRPSIAYCHLKDAYVAADGKHHYMPLGAGDLPTLEILRRFKHDGYDGFFSFEWEKKWHPELEAPERVFPQYVHKLAALWAQA